MDWKKICTLKSNKSGMKNGGWAYDAYPELETLDAYTKMTVADIKGPGVITCFHTTQQVTVDGPDGEVKQKPDAARGIILEVYYNDMPVPAVRVPLADFFADGCCGQAKHFGNQFIEKAPESYNCFIPMPFEKSAKVVLVNETERDYWNYSFVEYEELPEWDENLGYFHATWERFAFQLGTKTQIPLLHIDGSGHLLGRSWSVSTDEPFFNGFHFAMEANNEFRIDGEEIPRLDYLGSEDSFSFSWGFQKEYMGPYAGMNYIKNSNAPSFLSQLSVFRFLDNNVIRFNKSLDLTVNWSKERQFFKEERFMRNIEEVHKKGGGWIDYAATSYWYQKEIGYNHKPMLPLEERCRTVLRENPKSK